MLTPPRVIPRGSCPYLPSLSPAAHCCSLTYCWPHIAIMWCVNSPAKGVFGPPPPPPNPLWTEVIRDPLHSLRTLPPSITSPPPPFFPPCSRRLTSLPPLLPCPQVLLDFSPASLRGTRGRALLCKWYKKEGKKCCIHITCYRTRCSCRISAGSRGIVCNVRLSPFLSCPSVSLKSKVVSVSPHSSSFLFSPFFLSTDAQEY